MNNSKIAMHGFFIHGFPKLMRFQQHHDKVMRKFLPRLVTFVANHRWRCCLIIQINFDFLTLFICRLKKHLDKQGIDSGIYTLKWFFQCFLDRVSQLLLLIFARCYGQAKL